MNLLTGASLLALAKSIYYALFFEHNLPKPMCNRTPGDKMMQLSFHATKVAILYFLLVRRELLNKFNFRGLNDQ